MRQVDNEYCTPVSVTLREFRLDVLSTDVAGFMSKYLRSYRDILDNAATVGSLNVVKWKLADLGYFGTCGRVSPQFKMVTPNYYMGALYENYIMR